MSALVTRLLKLLLSSWGAKKSAEAIRAGQRSER
jgi:hypothetical protein